MPLYDVTITARITKTLRVTANNEDDACEMAHQEFDIMCDDLPENYTQDTDMVIPVG